jgi:multidrug resistance protein, MATE family
MQNSASWRVEIADTMRLSLPIALTQLGQVAMMTTDLMLLGRLGENVIAAAALAHTVLFAAFMIGMGLVAAVAPLAAQAFGARDPRGVRRALRVGIWVAFLAGVPLTLLQMWGGQILALLGQAPETSVLAGRYLAGLGWSLIPAWIFMAIRGFMGAVNRPEPALWITLVAIPVNFVVAWALIHGRLGMPQLDVLGAGLATVIVNIGMCVAAVVVAYTRRPFRKYRILGRFWRPDFDRLTKLLVIGVPIAGAYMLEYGVFAAAALLMGSVGTAALAAHQIALQVASILFMVPFGISMAATVRVGHAVGRRDAAAARRAGIAAILLGVSFMVSMTTLVAMTRHTIPLLFLGAATPEGDATVVLTASLLLIGMCFFVADGVQTVTAGALRGFNDTKVPLGLAALSFWGVGFAASWLFGFRAGLGAQGIWLGLSAGLIVYALLLVWRFDRLSRRSELPEVVVEAHSRVH